MRKSALLALIFTSFGLAWLLWPSPPDVDQAFTQAVVERGDVELSIDTVGSLTPMEIVSVGAQTSGKIERLHVQVGQRVKKGQLIAEIDSRTQANELQVSRLNIAAAKADMSKAEAAFETARLQLKRQETLFAGEAAAEVDLERARSEFMSAKAALETSRVQLQRLGAELSNAQLALGFTRITSPLDGTVLAVVTREGQTINANQSAPTIVKIGKVDQMKAKVQLSEADATRVRPGMDVVYRVAGLAETERRGQLKFVAPAPAGLESSDEPNASEPVYYTAMFDVPNPGSLLKTFMSLQARIIVETASNVLRVPSAALRPGNLPGQAIVNVIAADGRITPRTIHIGLDNGVYAVVKSNLKQGERVALLAGGEVTRPGMTTTSSDMSQQ